jgi:hypothetical protein
VSDAKIVADVQAELAIVIGEGVGNSGIQVADIAEVDATMEAPQSAGFCNRRTRPVRARLPGFGETAGRERQRPSELLSWLEWRVSS